MAKDLRAGLHRQRRAERGLSIVEVLVGMAILGIGLLGLILLQVMAFRGAGNGRGLQTGLLVGESVLDRIELEGRLSWLNVTDSNYNSVQSLSHLTFLDPAKDPPTLAFTLKGAVPDPKATDLVDRLQFYTATTTRTLIAAKATGRITECTVQVTFPDANQPSATQNGAAPTIYRTVTLTRRIRHA